MFPHNIQKLIRFKTKSCKIYKQLFLMEISTKVWGRVVRLYLWGHQQNPGAIRFTGH